MDFENEIPSPKTPVTPIINFENNEDVECEEVCIIGVNGRKLTSAVWKYFTQVQVGKEIKAKSHKNPFGSLEERVCLPKRE